MTQVPIILMKTNAFGIFYIILHYSYQMETMLKQHNEHLNYYVPRYVTLLW